MKFYHYTYNTRWEVMQDVGVLQANNGFGRSMPHPSQNDEETPALWGLHEAVPKEWRNQYLWDLLVGCFCYRLFHKSASVPNSLVLLECEVSCDDDIWVADWGAFNQHLGQEDALSYYRNSMTPLSNFDPSNHGMIAPELVSFSDIPATNAKCVMEIPFDHQLESIRLFVRNESGVWHGQPSPKKGYRLTP